MFTFGLIVRAGALTLCASAVLHAQAVGTSTTGSRTAQPRSVAPNSAAPATPRSAPSQPVGTLGPEAARALRGELNAGSKVGSGIPASNLGPSRQLDLGGGRYIPLSVADAPNYARGSSTLLIAPVSPAQVSTPAFYPTTEPPTWTVVPEEHPVQAWRLVDVEDTVCDTFGQCRRVKTRLQARWVGALGGYAFRDRVGRVWRVE